MRPISVLFTNNALGQRGGSETYIRDVALALLRRGHRPAVFSLVHGDVAAELRRATVPVVDDVTRLGEAPDVIHGHHHLETLIATLAFPGIPVVNFCHGWLPWEEMPLHHPSVRRYVAVDEVCVDRLVREEGLAPNQVELLLNFVDLERFRPRPPLPPRPARALILSNAVTAQGYGATIRAACDDAGITVDSVGVSAGNSTAAPEALLAGYDLVFAKGRTALEALVVGCATVLADAAGAGPLVTPENYELLRLRNFGIRELRRRHDIGWYREQIEGYLAEMATAVSGRARAEADMERAVSRLLDIYAEVMAAPAGPGDPFRAAARHCSRIALPLKRAHGLTDQLQMLHCQLDRARAAADAQFHVATAQAAATLDAQTRVDALLKDAQARRIEVQASEHAHTSAAQSLHQHIDALLGQVTRLEQEAVKIQSEKDDAARDHAVVERALQSRVDTLVSEAVSRDERIAALEREHAVVTHALQSGVDALVHTAVAREERLAESDREHEAETRVLQTRVDDLLATVARLEGQAIDARVELASALEQVRTLEQRIAEFQALPTLRLRDAVLRAPVMGPLLQTAARRAAAALDRTSHPEPEGRAEAQPRSSPS